jgi:predicted SnoaL-like aldol condensation-catalyzing enzyme
MTTDNASVVRRIVERVWNQGDLNLADHLIDSAYVNHGGLISDLVRGPEAIKISVALYRTAFPHLHIVLDRLVTDGDMVDLGWAAYKSWGFHSGNTGPSTYGEMLAGTTSSRLNNGHIMESWTTWDTEGALRRLESESEADMRSGPAADIRSAPPDSENHGRRRHG